MWKIEYKTAVAHNLATLRDNARVLMRHAGANGAGDGGATGAFAMMSDKRSAFLFLIMDFVPNYVWITHRFV